VTSAGLILAAGESRRMGGFPKALLDYHGERFLARLSRLFAERCAPVIVVLGAHAAEIRAALPAPAGVRYVDNPDWRDGQTSSFLRGLAAIPHDSPGVLFTLTDHPAVAPETLDALLAGAGRLRIPRYRGERGHPIWFSRDLIPELLALPPGGAARDVIRAHYPEAVWLETGDAGILADIDDRAAYRALTGADA
jgi:CTP:molybdopterin cytidylyltransferase MocA